MLIGAEIDRQPSYSYRSGHHLLQTCSHRAITLLPFLRDLRVLRQYERERKSALLPMRLTTDALAQLFGRVEAPLQTLRNWGMQGFDHSGPLKHWMARQAMNTDPAARSAAFNGNTDP